MPLFPPSSPATLLQWALRPPGSPPPDADWEAALAAARAQSVHLFLYPPLKRVQGLLPGPAWSRLRSDYLAAARDAERRKAQAGELLGSLAAAGIPVIPLKGLWLADHAYPEPADRAMHDLDLLVRAGDISSATAVLEAAGYKARGPGDDKHRVFLNGEWPLPVELHGRLDHAGPLALDPEPLWARAAASRCAGQPCLALEPHDQVLTLARHTLLHSLGFYPLRALLDIALVLKREGPALDLHALHRRAQALRMVRGLALVVAMAGQLAGLEREAEWPEEWRPDPGLLEEAWSLTLERGGSRAHPPEPLLILGTLRNWGARFRLLGGRLFLPRRDLEARYPWAARPGLRPVALACRAGSLARLYAGALVRLARRDPVLLEQLDISRERRGWLARIYPDPPP